MSSEELRKRLEALNGKPLENVPSSVANPAPKTAKKPRLRLSADPTKRPATALSVTSAALPASSTPEASAPQWVSLEACLPGATFHAPGFGAHYRIERRITEGAPWAYLLGEEIAATLQSPVFCCRLRRVTGIAPEKVVFLDLETLGLGGQPLFLIGSLRMSDSETLFCQQFLARTLDEEASILAAFAETLADAQLLVTFNGIAFDVPFLKTRADVFGVELPALPHHLDILPDARRRYRRQIGSCRLQALEQHICGRKRVGDVPGSDIPGVYREFTRTGNAAPLIPVLHHNLLDLATTADLLTRLWE